MLSSSSSPMMMFIVVVQIKKIKICKIKMCIVVTVLLTQSITSKAKAVSTHFLVMRTLPLHSPIQSSADGTKSNNGVCMHMGYM